ncbi:MAG: hypothetical protein LBK25_09510, partial [Treponema sp.]|nr:hypothetical protein [Treponema sp.]
VSNPTTWGFRHPPTPGGVRHRFPAPCLRCQLIHLIGVAIHLIGVTTNLIGVAIHLIGVTTNLIGVAIHLIGVTTNLIGATIHLIGVMIHLTGVTASPTRFLTSPRASDTAVEH